MRVLVVDDEPVARMTHLALLSRLPEVLAVGAESVAQARLLIDDVLPKIVVLDMQLPDGTGLEVMAELEARDCAAVLIVASANLEDGALRLPRSERLHLIGKPISLKALQGVVEKSLNPQRAQARIPFSISDYLQLACSSYSSIVLDCVGKSGQGAIVVHKGQLWSAIDDQGSGARALQRLTMQDMRVQAVSVPRPDAAANLSGPWEQQLIDALAGAA